MVTIVEPEKVNKQGDVFLRKSRQYGTSYIILTGGNKGQTELQAYEFHLSMEAFGGLPGYEYHSTNINLPREDLEKLTTGQIEELGNKDGFIKASIRIITQHGKDWLTEEYWKDTPYWEKG